VEDAQAGVGASRYFLTDQLPAGLGELARAQPANVLADLGAADGGIIFALDSHGLLGERVYAVDLNPERVRFCEALSTKVVGVVADATAIGQIADGSVDAVVASQLIEHLPDDRALAPEIARILRPGGWFYVASVMRGARAWWIHRANGAWALDPTHQREYRSRDEFRAALADERLAIDDVLAEPLRFPVTDLALRAAALAHLVPAARLPGVYAHVPSAARRLRIPVPGYSWIAATGRRL
jgi:SAM-dependent methyltransferase